MTITKEGALASFYTVNKATIKHLRVYFSPKQEGSGDPSPENIRPITGHTSISLTQARKNIMNIANAEFGYVLSSGKISAAKNNLTSEYLPIKGGDKIICSQDYCTDNGAGPQIAFFSDKVSSAIINRYTYGIKSYSRTFTAPSNAKYFRAWFSAGAYSEIPSESWFLNNINCQIEIYNKTNQYEPYQGSIQTIDWTNDIGAVYGGYVDLITGELIQTHKYVLLNDPDKWEDATGSDVIKYQYSDKFTDRKTFSSGSYEGLICTYAPIRYIASGYLIYGRWRAYSGNNAYTFGLMVDKTNISLDTIKTDATAGKIGICYELATPITYQLTSQQIQTFIGRNNVWSNADKVEIEYDLAESNDELYKRRNIILRSSPHIETASSVDGVVTCISNLKASLKSCKITFEPYQLGVGDPSPTNIRPISGWSAFNVYTADDMHYMVPNGWSSISNSGANIVYLGNGKYYVKLLGASDYIYSDWYPVKPFTIPTGDGRRFCMNNDDIQYFTIRLGDSSSTEFDSWSCSGETNRVRTGYAAMRDKLLANVKFNYKGNSEGCFKLEFIKNLRTTNTITLPSTFYGGYIDLITGELVQTHAYIELDGSSDEPWSTSGDSYSWSNETFVLHWGTIGTVSPNPQIYRRCICDSAKVSSNNARDPQDVNSVHVSYYHYSNIGFHAPLGANATITQLRNYLSEHPLRIVNPYVKESLMPRYQLTPQTLKTLKGVNNIWSDANGPISIQYWTH